MLADWGYFMVHVREKIRFNMCVVMIVNIIGGLSFHWYKFCGSGNKDGGGQQVGIKP